MLRFDWTEIAPAAVWTAIVAVVGILLRGQIARLVLKLLADEPGRTRDLIFDVLDTKTGHVRLRAMLDEVYADRIRRADEFHQISLANRDKLDAVVESQKMQGLALREVEDKMGELPRMTEALERVAEATAKISEEMQAVNLSMARIDEREKERERRWHQEHPHPNRREGDLA